MSPSTAELLALDVLTLSEHTEQAGDVFNVEAHQAKLGESVKVNEICAVGRDGILAAYAMLRAESDPCWFVGAFVMHPLHRTYTVMSELITKIAILANEQDIAALRSHVYKTNILSLAFHRRLGFQVTRENAKGFEFFISLDELASNPVVSRLTNRS